MPRLPAAFLAAFSCLAAALPAAAQIPEAPPGTVACAPRDVALALLEQEYGEVRVAQALTSTGHMLEIVANAATGTWTILESRPGGQACIRRAGMAWEAVVPPPAGEGL